jgi:hypothetical protein
MCVDYTSLNKACPKDLFPLPRMDQDVDLTTGCELLSFLDAYSGYHQIPLSEEDQSATMFISPFGCFCYVEMTFGLKNAHATYLRCMQFCFKEKIGCKLEVYVDDIVIESRKSDNLISDPEETFNNLRRFNIKLNPEKCTFRVPRGKLLGYIITKHNIEANPDKILAIARMDPIKNVKDIQQLMGCLTALSRFVSLPGERGLPLYKQLKKSDSFRWMEGAQKATNRQSSPCQSQVKPSSMSQ